MAADRRAARAEILHGVLELLGREIGELQRDGRQRDEAVRMLLAPGRKQLIVQRDDVFRDRVLSRVPPEEVHAERLDIDTALVHRGEPFRAEHDRRRRYPRRIRARQTLRDLREHAVRMHVDDFHALARDTDLLALRLRIDA